MIKKIFLTVGFIVLNSATTNCSFSQSSLMSHNELHEIIQKSTRLIDHAKTKGLSDCEIIEALDVVLAEAACADERPIQGKGANLERLLCFAGGVVTAGAIIAMIVYLKSKKAISDGSSIGETEVIPQPQALNQQPNNNNEQEVLPNNNQLENNNIEEQNIQANNERVLNVPQQDQELNNNFFNESSSDSSEEPRYPVRNRRQTVLYGHRIYTSRTN